MADNSRVLHRVDDFTPAQVDVETVAAGLADLVGSEVFKPLHDTVEYQQIRERFRDLAEQAIAMTL